MRVLRHLHDQRGKFWDEMLSFDKHDLTDILDKLQNTYNISHRKQTKCVFLTRIFLLGRLAVVIVLRRRTALL